MRKPSDKEHQFGGFIARSGGAVTEIHPSCTQRPRTSLNRGADVFGHARGLGCAHDFGCVHGLGGAHGLGRADGLDGCVG